MSNKCDIQEMLVKMGFLKNYIQRAFKVYEKNYGHSYNIEVITEIIVNLQNKDLNKKNRNGNNKDESSLPPEAKIIPFPYMHVFQAANLKINDKIDHRDEYDRFILSTIVGKQGTNLKIHYDGYRRDAIWCDYKKELYRFATAGSISKRKGHRFKTLKKGDYIDINPKKGGWRVGKIHRFDQKSGQIQVLYETANKDHFCWTHLDNKHEIAEYKSKSGNNHPKQFNLSINIAEFNDVLNIWNLSEPLSSTDLKNIFYPLIRKIRNKFNYSFNGKIIINQIDTNILDTFWKQHFEQNEEITNHCKKWINSLKQKMPNGLYDIKYALDLFNQTIVKSLCDDLVNIDVANDGKNDNDNDNSNNSMNHNDLKNQIGDLVINDNNNNNNNSNGGKKRKLDDAEYNRPNKRRKLSVNNVINDVSSPSNNNCNNDESDILESSNSNNDNTINTSAMAANTDNKNTSNNKESNDNKYSKADYDALNEKYLKTKQLYQTSEKRLNDEIKSKQKLKNKLNKKILKKDDLLNEYKMEIDKLKKSNNELKKQLVSWDFGTDNIDKFGLDELNELKLKMSNKIKLIESTEKELIDNTYKCVACMDKPKNISFMDGCSHIALCDECEAKATSKVCPICQTPYKNVRKINF